MSNVSWLDKVHMPECIRKNADYLYTAYDQEIISDTDDEGNVIKKYPRAVLENMFKRGILDKFESEDGKTTYKVASVNARFDSFVILEKSYWRSLPAEVRDSFNNDYIMNPEIWLTRMLKMHDEKGLYEMVLPVEECVKILEESNTDYYYLAECNCNNYIGGCDKDKYRVCTHFPSSPAPVNSPVGRGLAERVDKQACIDAVIYADKQGLVHKTTPDKSHFCNCCSCCCIHHHRGPGYEKFEDRIKDDLIQTPYIIEVNPDACINCRACEKRCPYGALTSDGTHITLNAEKCWGCGVCRVVCPKHCLTIKKR